MSTTDKTRSKLMDSMRKTKAGTKTEAAPAKAEARPAAESKPAAPKAPAKKAAPKAAPRKAAASGGNYSSRGTRAGDNYESGARIWPD